MKNGQKEANEIFGKTKAKRNGEGSRHDHNKYKRSKPVVNLVGKRIGLLTIIARDFESIEKGITWNCICDCGNTVVKSGAYLRNKNIKVQSCGCRNPKIDYHPVIDEIELVGKKIDNLTVLYANGKSKSGHKVMHCRCDCGKELDVRLYNLQKGIAKSCKCNKTRNIDGEESFIGKKFERLTILDIYYDEDRKMAMAKCRCECGTEKDICLNFIKTGRIKSCGCYKKDKFIEWSKRNELTNMRFGSLIVLKEELIENKDRKSECRTWLCKCDCGHEVVRDTGYLTQRNNPSCGCIKTAYSYQDFTGLKIGNLLVGERDYTNKKHGVYWLCHCDCGNDVIKSTKYFKGAKNASCGCLRTKEK